MKRIFILAWVVIICVGLFAEGVPKGAKLCSVYTGIYDEMVNQTFDNSDGHIHFIPDWFEYLEFADNNYSGKQKLDRG